MTDDVPAPPATLQSPGARLWQAVVEEYILDGPHLNQLHRICALADDLALMRKELRGAELVVEGSTGQPAPHPLIRATREHSSAISRMLRDLLGAAALDKTGTERSDAGRKLALLKFAN